jgi:hypothetical protein
MIGSDTQTWNLRDSHMIKMLKSLMSFLKRQRGKPVKAVVWVSFSDHKIVFVNKR